MGQSEVVQVIVAAGYATRLTIYLDKTTGVKPLTVLISGYLSREILPGTGAFLGIDDGEVVWLNINGARVASTMTRTVLISPGYYEFSFVFTEAGTYNIKAEYDGNLEKGYLGCELTNGVNVTDEGVPPMPNYTPLIVGAIAAVVVAGVGAGAWLLSQP